ncbi:hypothetical protein MCOR27_009944 [Pyricularia oryzae]|nr:hypothetical protein MCOR01_000616 [Pyricularia oryzae]KAI6262864.1 hypothetical protein MCOR19_001032 [Pyricularia oryzae]KAI6268967.1 hypothetical protein MCOR27_009944 [Pyricularia oryzae]KAI6274318.1 hypothetical protein MCOR34_011516 [Pyricularia oryzae]KAI6294337.1 hypothetical protein MCOR29_011503 [Pyricularia oryzae]
MSRPSTAIGNPTGDEVLVTTWLLASIISFMISARLYLRLKIKRLHLQPADMVLYSSSAMKTGYHPEHVKLGRALVGIRASCKGLFPLFLTKLCAPIWVTIAYCIASVVVVISLVLFLWFPIPLHWTLDRRETYSPRQQRSTFHVNCALHLFGELFIFSLPFLMLRHARLKTEVKAGVYATFAAGLATIGFGITREVLILKSPGISGQDNAKDSTIDIHMGLAVACMPSLRLYLGHILSQDRFNALRAGPQPVQRERPSNQQRHVITSLDSTTLIRTDTETRRDRRRTQP